MGRTIPSFRNVLAIEKAEWKPFRNALDKSERKDFDDMFDIPRLYLSACSNSVQLVPLHPIIMSILFHHYKELTEIISEVEQMEQATVSSKKRLAINEEEEKKQEDSKTTKKKKKSPTAKKQDYLSYFFLTDNKNTNGFPTIDLNNGRTNRTIFLCLLASFPNFVSISLAFGIEIQ